MLARNFFLHLLVVLAVVCGIESFKRKSSKRSIDGSNWMKNNLHTLGRRSLKQICIPGSHDAGMSEYTPGTAFAHPCNVLTQSVPILGQLMSGARYFDVRPVIGNRGRYLTGHYARLPDGGWQGANGQPIQSIVDQINQFISSRQELVIVKLSHTLNTDLGNKNYRPFDQREWDGLFKVLDKTYNLYFSSDPKVHLPSLTLNQFTADGKRGAVVYIVDEPGVNLGSRLGKGYFYQSNIGTFDQYSNTPKLDKMFADQLKKMQEHSQRTYFLLSWTLTQGYKDLSLCRLHLGKSIKQLAAEAHSNLPRLIPAISQSCYPNILYLDEITNTFVTEIALEINRKVAG